MPNRADLALADVVTLDEQMDRSEFSHLLSESRDAIFRYIFSLVPQVSDAEDLFQRTSVVLWKKFADYDPTRSFAAWACGVAYYEVQNFRRGSGAKHLVFSSEVLQSLAARLSDAEHVLAGERVTTLRGCLEKLPVRDRTLVRKIFWDGQNYDDVSRENGLALQTTYNRMHLIRRRLLECISRQTATRD